MKKKLLLKEIFFFAFEQLQSQPPKEVQTATIVATSSPPNEINVKNSIATTASENPIKMEESLKSTTTSQLSGKRMKTSLKIS